MRRAAELLDIEALAAAGLASSSMIIIAGALWNGASAAELLDIEALAAAGLASFSMILIAGTLWNRASAAGIQADGPGILHWSCA